MKFSLLCMVLLGAALGTATAATTQDDPFQRAETLFKSEHWAEARDAYDEARRAETDWHSPKTQRAVEGAVACLLKLKLWNEATTRTEELITQTKGSFEEAAGQRFLGGLYLTMPHQGTKQGGQFLRGEGGQGVYVYSWKKDRKEALQHYERARDLIVYLRAHFDDAANRDTPERRQALDAAWIGVDFDLATTLAARSDSPYGFQSGLCGWWWGGLLEAEEDSAAVEEADYEEARYFRGAYGQNQEPPTGIPLGPDGQPQFIQTPKDYAPSLGDGPKIRCLLAEIQRLDSSEKKEDAAKALFREAMIARSLYGPETAQTFHQSQTRYDRFGRVQSPEKDPDEPKEKIWELGDDQALTVAGGRLRVVTLPPGESPLALLRAVRTRYPQSTISTEAQYACALYLQTRQQFPQALAEYKTLLAESPAHKRAGDARAQIASIEKGGVLLGQSAVYLPGEKPRLSFTYRNADTIRFKAIRFDMAAYVQDRMIDKSEDYWDYSNIDSNLFYKERWKKYLRASAGEWTETVRSENGNRAAEGSTQALSGEPGAYIVEARTPAGGNDEVSRVLVLVTDMALVQKNAKDFGLIYLCDARSGQPLAEKAVRVYEHWSDYDQAKKKQVLHSEEVTLVTDGSGTVKYKRKHSDHGSSVEAIVTGADERMAFSFFQYWNEAQYVQGDDAVGGERVYIVTDRPVYRPGSIVKFRLWQRSLAARRYQPPVKEGTITVEVCDAKNVRAQSLSLKTDEMGGATGEYPLGDEPPLGVYSIRVNGYRPDARHVAGGLFRVEEYKKPEFEVKVKPSTTQARLGEKFRAKIEARYYFGSPVAQARVSYKVFRENYDHVYLGAGEYDWLYGKGYGRYYYAYPWLSWWERWGPFIDCGMRWRSPYLPGYRFPWGTYGGDEDWSSGFESGTRKALRELVAQGETELKADGTCEVEVDTARAKAEQGNRDHRYTVEAEVRDASRRTIEGKGSVIVTRQEFYAFVETDGGWYEPKNEAFVEVRALTPDNVPVAVKGEVAVARIRYGGPNNDEASEETVKRWDAETDADGRLSFKWPIAGEGQWRITFRAQDSRREEVLGNAVFWARGPKFDGRVYRFNDLEIIADKRSYKVGETAHLLVNTAENHSRILFSDNVTHGSLLSYRFIDIAGRSGMIDVPIDVSRSPNFFVEATLVRNGRVHTEVRELFVPPERGLLNVSITTDKPVYKPGEKGTVHIEAADPAGKPAVGEVALTAFDEAVTYIQDEFGPSPRVFFHGQKRYHHAQVNSSTGHLFSAAGVLRQPQTEVYTGKEPDGWRGSWGLDTRGLQLFGQRELASRKADGARFNGMMSAFAVGGVVTMSGAGGMFDSDVGRVGGKAFSIQANAIDALLFAAPGSPTSAAKSSKDEGGAAAPAPAFVEPEIRTNFADTALWLPAIKLDADGKADAEITFPQSLTTWRVHGYAMTAGTQVGDATAHATTTKNLLVRLQSPRFFVERDEAVLSASVNNYLKTAQLVKAELIVPAAAFRFVGEQAGEFAPDAEGNMHLRAEATVEATGEHRFDWPVKALKAGLAKISVKALTTEESDGMRLAFPVIVHGVNKTVAQSGSYRAGQEGERELAIDLPQEIDPEQTRLEITLSPSLAGVMIDALPYLAGYPYGCVEQTMSRFYPTVLVRDTLKKMGTDLETVGKQRKAMNAADLRHRFGDSPVFDSDELDRMTRAGLARIYGFQRNDGGWGWWREDDSSIFQTAYVLQGLNAARHAGVSVDDGVYGRGLNFLQSTISKELAKPKNERELGDLTTQAYLAYILSLEHRFSNEEQRKWLASLYKTRGELNNYGRSLLALAMHNESKNDEARTLLRNVLQFVERDDSNETAWVRTPQEGWWFWWNNDIETNAWTLKALAALDPKSDLAPRLVKWLLNNRRGGYYWRSTRDTAQVISAMTDYMQASGESAPDYSLTVKLDGEPVKEVRVTKENLFAFDNRVLLQGLQIKPGAHKITLGKTGEGALYYSAGLSYFTHEEDVKGAGNEIFVEREYFKLVPKSEEVALPSGAAAATLPANQPVALEATGRTETRAGFARLPLKSGDTVASGDQIEVVLKITAKNTYDYLAFEDMKPAGCEPVELRSGGRWAGGLCANMELRDEKVVFFIGLLEQGQHILRYKLRAETPGQFHALPTSASAMYAPEVRAISDEMRLKVKD